VRVVAGEMEPVSEFENLWIKYIRQEKAFEINQREVRINRIRILIQDSSLGYEQLRLILDRSGEFKFTEQELLIMRQQLAAKTPTGYLTSNSFIVYSRTDGQD